MLQIDVRVHAHGGCNYFNTLTALGCSSDDVGGNFGVVGTVALELWMLESDLTAAGFNYADYAKAVSLRADLVADLCPV